MLNVVKRFEEHKIHDTLDKVEEIIGKCKNSDDIDSNQLDYIVRYEQLNRKIRTILDSVDPYFVSIDNLNHLNKHLINTISNLNNYLSNNRVNYFNSFNNFVEKAITQLAFFNSINTSNDISDLRDDISSFRKSVGQYRRNIEEKYENYVDKLNDDYKELSTQKKSTEKELEELKKNITTEKKRIDNAITQAQNQVANFQSQFSESQEKRRENFSDFIDGLEVELDNLKDNLESKNKIIIDDLIEEQKEMKNESEEKIKEYFKIMDKHKEDVEKVAGTIAITGMAHGYKKIADSERKSKRIWQGITVASIIGLIIFGIYFVNAFKPLNMPETSVNWASFLSRLIVVSAIGTLTGYSAKQASKHLEAERYNRKMELELATIDPYLAILPEENIYKVKEELAAKLFGNKQRRALDSMEEDKREPEVTTNMLMQLLRKALIKFTNN